MKVIAVFLILYIGGYSDSTEIYVHAMPSMEQCKQQLLAMRIDIGDGDENENFVTGLCSYSLPFKNHYGKFEFHQYKIVTEKKE